MAQALSYLPHDATAAVEAAVRELVECRKQGASYFVNLPLLYPDGSFVTLQIDPAPGGFRISDAGFAYREIEATGHERSFAKTAHAVAEREGVSAGKRTLFTDATVDDLHRAMCDVAMASWRVADRVYERASDGEDADVIESFRDRLLTVFGIGHIREQRSIAGSSATSWDVSAIVDVDHSVAVFQIVSNHANSVYRTATAFHDLALLRKPPKLVAVVPDKQSMGANLSLLHQAGSVIEMTAPDDTIIRAAA